VKRLWVRILAGIRVRKELAENLAYQCSPVMQGITFSFLESIKSKYSREAREEGVVSRRGRRGFEVNLL
jgi:hypothetical protein